MMKALACVLATCAIGCAADMPADDSDPVFDGKADAPSNAVDDGALAWSTPLTLTFSQTVVYATFSLSGDADVTIETSGTTNLDTIAYIYSADGGAYLGKNDDGGAGKYSKLTSHLGAGDYLAVVKRRGTSGMPTAQLTGTCSGDGCTPVMRGCTPTEPRTSTPDVFVGPGDWQASIEAEIDGATTSLDVQMYLFTVTDIANHVISAYKRGVAVRVLLDPHEDNSVVQGMLTSAGVPNHTDPTVFSFAHAKYMIVDGREAVILSGNFNAGAVNTKSGGDGERNYGFIDRDADDIADLQSVYTSDWTAGAEPDLSCTRLIVSPINSEDRILAHVQGATTTLDIEVLYLDQTDLQQEIIAAHNRGVAVRIMLSDPAKNPQNTATQQLFQNAGIDTKILLTNYLHAKMVMVDGVALVGSENMSTTSWTKNREVGGLIFEPEAAAVIHAQYEKDWAAAQ